MENTAPAKEMIFTPEVVAQDGYDAMIRGDMEVISKLTPEHAEWFKTIPTTPKEILLKQIFDMQK